jgi:hypothetical protein
MAMLKLHEVPTREELEKRIREARSWEPSDEIGEGIRESSIEGYELGLKAADEGQGRQENHAVFSLRIRLGSAAMETTDDVGSALVEAGKLLRRSFGGVTAEVLSDPLLIRDINGNTCGEFVVLPPTGGSDGD